MVRFGQLSKNNCLKFVFNWSLEPVPHSYDDQFYRNILHLNEELEKLVRSETVYFWSSVVYNPQCQKVTSKLCLALCKSKNDIFERV